MSEGYYLTEDVSVPEWANWIAQDATGEWFFYEYEPSLTSPGNFWMSQDRDTHATFAFLGLPDPRWDETLTRIVR